MITITQLTNPAIAGQPVQFQATTGDIAIGFGDGSIASNSVQFSHTFFSPGTFAIGFTLHIKNQSEIGGTKVVVQPATIVPPPQPPPPPPPPPTTGRTLLGGWRLTCPFSRGGIAIDWSTSSLYLVGHAQRNEVLHFQLPPMGTGTDSSQWPALQPLETIPCFWDSTCYAMGLGFFRGKLWASPRKYYDTAPPASFAISATDGDSITINLPRQAYSGFVKVGAGIDPMIGCGGYESGQGWATSPTLATLDGQSLIFHPQTDQNNWQAREYRDTNYSPINGVDSWVAIAPKTINGVLTGIWASDRVKGGGLLLPEGFTFWVWQGTGVLDYNLQNETFSKTNQTSAYLYDATTHQRIGWTLTDLGEIGGQEIGPDGKVYLCEQNAWKSGMYNVDPVLKVYG